MNYNIIILHVAYSCWLLIGQDLLLPTGYAALISHTPEMTIFHILAHSAMLRRKRRGIKPLEI